MKITEINRQLEDTRRWHRCLLTELNLRPQIFDTRFTRVHLEKLRSDIARLENAREKMYLQMEGE